MARGAWDQAGERTFEHLRDGTEPCGSVLVPPEYGRRKAAVVGPARLRATITARISEQALSQRLFEAAPAAEGSQRFHPPALLAGRCEPALVRDFLEKSDIPPVKAGSLRSLGSRAP